MDEHDDLDRILDAALTTYAKPDADLAPRVLRQVSLHAAAQRHRKPWFWIAGLAAATATAALLLLIAPWRTVQPGVAPRTQASVVPPAEPAPSVQRHIAVHRTTRVTKLAVPRVSVSSAPPPKQDVFPAPAPLSPQEQALVHLVTASSTEQRETLLRQQQQVNEPIRISAISIPPIAPPTKGQE